MNVAESIEKTNDKELNEVLMAILTFIYGTDNEDK